MADEQQLVTFFMCTSCRKPLFSSEQVSVHKPKRGGQCSSWFFDVLPDWVEETGDDEGKIYCPHCNARIGAYKWSGDNCACSEWMCPFIAIHKRRMDEREVLVRKK
ncbi:hypothetical protein J8273_7785 [Carpediemonas membranifera]|uniref:Uncharacterized protein n=1 Tax=Carpediemonas membranifera TaxID=201153 RepID=A0A8J6ASK4_9EUKA|nr:hypothetical protein J8273_7785 [Carpediemonas membranifera]|eukprot:KAG9390435.1 hypothetical protein J8273_7785 [Carpediemonas membranifera]